MMKILKSVHFYSFLISLLELVSLFILLKIVEGDILIKYIILFLILQIGKVLVYNRFRLFAVDDINIENRIEFESLKKVKLNNIYKYRIEDEKANTEILASSQEIANAKYADFQKKNAITTILFFFIYGLYKEPYIFAVFILGAILYVVNKYVISKTREKKIALVSKAIDDLGEQLGIFVSNLKFFLFASHGVHVESRIHEGFDKIRREQSKVNLINYSSRPLLESIAVIFIVCLFMFGIDQSSIIGLVVIILKSVPLLAQINFANSTLDLAERLKVEKIQSTDISKIHNENWNNLAFTYNNIDLMAEKGDKILLLGESGSGKSTLLEMLAGITKANFNLITDIENYHHWCFAKDALVYVNQQVKPWGEELSGFIDLSSNNEVLLSKFFTQSELSQMRQNGLKLNELSGGQFQRVLILKYLDFEGIILLDESISGLDQLRSGLIVQELLDSNSTVILITHSQIEKNKFDKIWQL